MTESNEMNVDETTPNETTKEITDDSSDANNGDSSENSSDENEQDSTAPTGENKSDEGDEEMAEPPAEQDEEESNDAEEEELWDLKVILSPQKITTEPTSCSTPGCSLVACSIWSSNLNPEEPWFTCLDCQAGDFGGWPDKAEEIPLKVLRREHWDVLVEKCTVDGENAAMPDIPKEGFEESQESPTSTEETSPSSNEEGEELWELKLIMSPKDLLKKTPCSTDGCSLVACSAWVSSFTPDEVWFTCLDCQKEDFDGFPEKEEELPVKFLSEENRKLILELCTVDSETAELPNLPTEPSLAATAGNDPSMATITPPPGYNRALAENQSNVIVGAARGKKKSVTPVPGGGKDSGKENKAPPKPKAPSKEALAIHRKWQVEAEKLGGPEARIVVSKPAAKKLIFDMLHDAFRPMNITEVYQKLKAIVPSPILKSCLDDMADTYQGNPFADDDSDDEDKPAKKKAKKSTESTEEYSGSLRLKEGRNVNNNLYYVDYTKLQNNGNGLDPDKRNDLYADLEKAKCEEEALKKQLQETAAETARLLAEPLNDELATLLVDQEKEMEELNEKLESCRAFAGNEKYVKQLGGRVAKMATFWRKRKRQCMEFLMLMEDSTEGTVSVKKCLSGDGQICIDSDEGAIKGAISYSKNKKNFAMARKGGLKNRASNGASGLNPDPNFIGVKLNSNGSTERVYMEE